MPKCLLPLYCMRAVCALVITTTAEKWAVRHSELFLRYRGVHLCAITCTLTYLYTQKHTHRQPRQSSTCSSPAQQPSQPRVRQPPLSAQITIPQCFTLRVVATSSLHRLAPIAKLLTGLRRMIARPKQQTALPLTKKSMTVEGPRPGCPTWV